LRIYGNKVLRRISEYKGKKTYCGQIEEEENIEGTRSTPDGDKKETSIEEQI
jgi:hypothetical protein